MLYYQVHIDEALEELQSSKVGLSKKQATDRLKKYGPNTVRVRGEPLWRKLIEPFASVFIAVLAAAAVISLVQRESIDAIIIIAIITISAIIYYAQRFSTERILRALQKKDLQKVEVMRDGVTTEVWVESLVPGDIILLAEGQKVPADVRLVHAANVRCDESLLTGESVPVSKQTHPLEGKRQVYERTNMLFQGSFVVSGEATALVVNTGNNTEFGHLAVLSAPTDVSSPVQQKIDRLVSQIIAVVGVVSVLVFGLAMFRGMEFAEALRFVLALAVSAVPEGLPVAITIVLVLGMRRMAKKKALVRNMKAIESIGIITTIATDKTGTLTKNMLTVQKVWWLNETGSAAKLASAVLLSVNSNGDSKVHDPLDSAMKDFAKQRDVSIPRSYKREATIPFEHRFAMSGNVYKIDGKYELILKGAPEQVLDHCSLSKSEFESAHHELHSLTGEGFRVIAMARAKLKKPINSFEELPKKGSLEFAGFLAVADELRKEAHAAVLAAQDAGVTVRMVTGDHFETAYSIGKKLGMVQHRGQVFDSRTTDSLTKKKFSDAVNLSRVFARVIPEHKHRILSVLKENDITAMTGDGVNDVPALTNAHVGVAMGSGSQIAKEAGDIVILDNNFRSIITAMHEGRIIFSNIRRMLFYVLATNAGEVLTMLGALVIGIPLPIVAVQILWINLVTDTTLMIPLGLEPGEAHEMKTKPRPPKAPILGKLLLSRMVLIALSMAVVTIGTFMFFLQSYPEEYARTLSFNVLVIMQWANAFNARSELQSILTRLRVHNKKFYIGLVIAVSLQAVVLFGPLQEALHVVPVAIEHLAITGLLATAVPIIVSEAHKLFSRRFRASQALKNAQSQAKKAK